MVKFIPIADQNETRRVVGMETKRDEAHASVPQELQGVPTRLQYERRDDDDQGRSDEASATLQRQSCTDLRADDVCNSHGEAGVPQNVATSDEPTQCSQICRDIDDARRCRRMDEIETKSANGQHHQEAAGSGSKKAIVKADAGYGQSAEAVTTDAVMSWCVHLTETLVFQRPNKHADEQEGHERAKRCCAQMSDRDGAGQRTDKRNRDARRQDPSRQPYRTQIVNGGTGGTGEPSQFARA